jgi:hypothetical protein
MKDIDTERSFHVESRGSGIAAADPAGFAGRRRPACGKIRHLSTVDRNSLPP